MTENYIKANNSGKGFITHNDQEIDGLSFECIDDLNKVTGDAEKISAWVERVGGIILTEDEYTVQKTTAEKTGVENQLISLEDEKVALNVKLAEKVEILKTKTK